MSIVAGRATIVGAAATDVGKVRDHNEDAHFLDADTGLFLVCDGMGGHAAGEVASALAIRILRARWTDADIRSASDEWIARGTADAKKALLGVVRDGVVAAHQAILAEAERDPAKKGMGTTVVGGLIVGGELVFAQAGDSRAYIVRDGISMQLTEDHTLLQRLLAAGIDVDVSGDGSRFRSMLTNALGIGPDCKVSTFVVPLADGDRFMLCSDGISEYVSEAEVGEVLAKQPSPARAAQKLVELALDRGGGDNATAIVVRVLEAGETPIPADQRRRDDLSIGRCELWGTRMTPQQRLRALRIAIPRDYAAGATLPAHTLGDRVAWIIVEGELSQQGERIGPGGFVYPESLIATSPVPDKAALAVVTADVRALALRSDDFRELCDDDTELGEAILEGLTAVIATKPVRAAPARDAKSSFARTDPSAAVPPPARPDPEVTPTVELAASPRPIRLPTEPEIERYFEIDADEPPAAAVEQAPERAIVTTHAADSGTITETVTETDAQTLTVTVVEGDAKVIKSRAISSNESTVASGTISERRPTAPSRGKRQSEGWDE